MSKGKYDKINNYNLSYENFLEAVAEFDGFISGISNNDIFLFTLPKKEYDITKKILDSERDNLLDFFIKNISSRILDRTTGTYFFDDMFNGRMHDTYFQLIAGNKDLEIPGKLFEPQKTNIDRIFGKSRGIGKYLHIIGPTSGNNIVDALSNNAFQNCVPMILEDGISLNMNDTIRYYDVSKLQSSPLLDKTGTPIYTEEDGVRIPKEYYSGAEFDKDIKNPEINKNKIGDRFTRPTLCGMVFRHPKASWCSRNKSHLPIFFNAINAIEMSRCTPYIDIKIVTRKYGENDRQMGDINQVKFMRFTKKNGDSKFELDDSIGFGDYRPVNNAETAGETKIDNSKLDYSYMDVFTTPATFSNANVNKENGYIFSKNGNVNDPILEPISPFLSLQNLTVSINSAGFGLMASKKASLSMTLHDRSRLRDLAPILSTTQFATTKIIIEYGWNHPEGGVTSDNPIGKYLDALKDRSVFQVVGSDFKFGSGNTVDIDVSLAAYGFRQTERIHCGMGPEVPLNVLNDYIEKAASDIIGSLKGKEDKQVPEIRQKVKTNSRAARSLASAISWNSYEEIAKSLKNGDKDDIVLDKLKLILNPVQYKKSEKTDVIDNSIDTNTLETIIYAESEVKNSIARVFGKLSDLENPQAIDAFASSYVSGYPPEEGISESSIRNDIAVADDNYDGRQVSLGKIISHFIGHPLASSCLYDEVQLVFYPLNHHAAGGRVHTTASFPIPVKMIKDKIVERLRQNSHLSIKSFFALLEKIVRDRNLPAYCISDLYTKETKLKSAEPEDFRKMMADRIKNKDIGGLGFDESSQDDKELIELLESDKTGDDFYNALNKKEAIEKVNKELSDFDKEIKLLAKAEIDLNFPYPNKPIQIPNGPLVTSNAVANLLLSGAKNNYAAKSQERDNMLSLSKRYKVIKDALISEAVDERKSSLKQRCENLYTTDGLTNLYPAEDKFIRPNIAMDFEVIDVIEPPKKIKSLFKRSVSSKGLQEDKQILRVHIYDEESVMDPEQFGILNSLIEGTSNKTLGGKNYEKIKENLSDMSFNEIKQIVKRSYPTIIYGAQNSTVNNISVSANTSGQLANVLMVESYGNLKNGQVDGFNYENEFESAVLLPNTVSIDMMGMPMIGRGNNIFVDFSTNTSVDNIYTVKSVTHTISAGNFKTSIEAVPSQMGAISNFKENIVSTIEHYQKLSKT